MKSPKQKQKRKSKAPELTEEEVKRLLIEAGFVFIDKKQCGFGKPEKDLHQGETIIYPEGSIRGIRVK